MHNYNWKEYIKKKLLGEESEYYLNELNEYFSFEYNYNEEKILILVEIVSLCSNENILMNIRCKFKKNLVDKKEFNKGVLILFDPNKLTNKDGKENSFVLVYMYNKEQNEEKFHREEFKINNFKYYLDIFDKQNNKEEVSYGIENIQNIFNKMKIKNKWEEKYVFLGLCFLIINDKYFSWDTKEDIGKKIWEKIKEIIKYQIFPNREKIYDSAYKKLISAFRSQSTKNQSEKDSDFILNIPEILVTVKEKIIPNIKHYTEQGEKFLNLLQDFLKKNDGQIYTPNHIIDFMCDITDISFDSTIIDPVCGSGSFLFHARSKMIIGHENDFEKIKKINENLIGIEKSLDFFIFLILRTLIHEANSFEKTKFNIYNGNLFDEETQKHVIKSINKSKSTKNVILMNPPFTDNNQESVCTKQETKEKLCNESKDCKRCKDIKNELCEKHKECKDYENFKNECYEKHASGFCYVKKIADVVGSGMLAAILPLNCSKDLKKHRKLMLETHTLKAVFSLPDDLFYPVSSVNTCIMLFELGVRHNSKESTFFGYYKEDGFDKKKNEGYVEKINWENTKNEWLNWFKNRLENPGFSILKNVNYDDEWLAEAYMETDYSRLTENDFIQTIRDFIAFKVKSGWY